MNDFLTIKNGCFLLFPKQIENNWSQEADLVYVDCYNNFYLFISF